MALTWSLINSFSFKKEIDKRMLSHPIKKTYRSKLLKLRKILRICGEHFVNGNCSWQLVVCNSIITAPAENVTFSLVKAKTKILHQSLDQEHATGKLHHQQTSKLVCNFFLRPTIRCWTLIKVVIQLFDMDLLMSLSYNIHLAFENINIRWYDRSSPF